MALIRDTGDTPPDGRALAAPLGAGAAAGFAAGIPMLALLMTAGALADDPTARPGVDSTLLTMPNAVTQFTFGAGTNSFTGDYGWLAYPGIGVHFAAASILGVIGAILIASLLGRRPSTPASALAGIVYGLLVQVVLLFGVVGGIQNIDTVETSVPIWAWWTGHLVYGASLGLLAAPMMRAAAGQAETLTASR